MDFSTLLLLLAVSSTAFASWEMFSSEELDARCDSSCPDDEATRSCCQGMGYATGYCKPYGRAECEGRRSYYHRAQQRTNGRMAGGARMGGRQQGGSMRSPSGGMAQNHIAATRGRIRVQGRQQGDLQNDDIVIGTAGDELVTRRNSTGNGGRMRRGAHPEGRYWRCDAPCKTGGHVPTCCFNHHFDNGNCNGGEAFCTYED